VSAAPPATASTDSLKGLDLSQLPSLNVNKEIVREIVVRIVEVAKPEKVVLFGSAARGQSGPRSDLDFLVIVPPRPDLHRRKLAGIIYRRLSGTKQPADIVVVSSEDVKRYKDCSALVIYPALKEGKVVYAS